MGLIGIVLLVRLDYQLAPRYNSHALKQLVENLRKVKSIRFNPYLRHEGVDRICGISLRRLLVLNVKSGLLHVRLVLAKISNSIGPWH